MKEEKMGELPEKFSQMKLNLNDKVQKSEVKKCTIEQFIGIFTNAVSDNLCSEFVNWFNEIKEHGLTWSSLEDSNDSGIVRKDEVVHIPTSLPSRCFPKNIVKPLWKEMSECYNTYYNEYAIARPMTSYSFNVRRVPVSGGFHQWHHEHSYERPHRVLAWHLTIEAPEMGGETEFLYQSMRLDPKVGQLVIWPAGFTHKHRGNPPLKGHKTYITGWFEDCKNKEIDS